MIIIGIILLVLGLLTGIGILWTIGLIVLIIGLVLLALSFTAPPPAGPRFYNRRYW